MRSGLDAFAEAKVDDGFKRALATFAAVRALNALISVAPGTELATQPAGVGLNFAPGQGWARSTTSWSSSPR
jgi:hypothetical protein